VHHIAPKDAKITCSGTQGQETCPWSSVANALQSGSIKGGDTLVLLDGLHDRIEIRDRSFNPSVVIQSKTARNAIVDTIFVRTASGFTFRELTILSTLTYPYPLFNSTPDTSRIVIEDTSLQSVAKVDDVLSWTQDQWLERRRHGIWLYGTNSRVSNNTLVAVQSGIWTWGQNSVVNGNRITELTADGLRAGSGDVFRNNYVANFLRVDQDHLDGFQSIGDVTNPVRDLVLDGNVIVEWAHSTDHPLRASLQGIGMFDGFYDNFKIINNVVSVTAYHGISVYGGRGGIIANNTVVHQSGNPEKYPWIGVFAHKNGTPSQGVVVANNLAMAFIGGSAADNVNLTDNQVIFYPNVIFKAVTSFDYRPKADSGLIDTANPTFAPAVDITGSARPQGKGPDKGAYEVSVSVEAPALVEPVEAPVLVEPVEDPAVVEPVVTSPKPTAPIKGAKQPKSKSPSKGQNLDTFFGETSGTWASVGIDDIRIPIRQRRFWTDGINNTK
jgi:parallel beta-helix repeat protein